MLNDDHNPDAKVMPFEMQIVSMKRIFRSLNPEVDPELIDWEHELDSTLTFPENRLEMSIKFPGYNWFKDVGEEKGVKKEALAEYEEYLDYLLSALPEEMRPEYEKVFEDYKKRVRSTIEKKLRIAPLKREREKLKAELEEAKRGFVPRKKPPAAPPKKVELPPVSEEEGITDEWLDAVRKISPQVEPEVMTTTAYKYDVGLYKYIPQFEDSLPMGIMPLETPVEVEEFLKLGTYDGWTWRPEDITYLGDYAKYREIWGKTYTRRDLEPLIRKDLNEIAGVKHVSWSGSKEDVIQRILGVEVAPAVPAVPVAAPPKVLAPPPKKVEKGFGFYEERQLRDRFYARLSRAGVRVTPEIRAEYREKYSDLEKRFRDVDREQAMKQAGDQIDALADDIIRRPRLPRRVAPPVEKVPPIPLDICPEHKTKMERVSSLPIKITMEREVLPEETEIPYVMRIIRTTPEKPPPQMRFVPIPETMEIYYCEEGNHFFERVNKRTEERSLAYLLRAVERERRRIERLTGVPTRPPYGRTLAEQLAIQERELERNPRFGEFLRSSGFSVDQYYTLDELSKRALRDAFRKLLRFE